MEKIIFSLTENGEKNVKLLGIYLDGKLKWDAHIKHLCKEKYMKWFFLNSKQNKK